MSVDMGHGLSVVVVEDHPLQGSLLRQALARRMPACQVELFLDGLAAFRRLMNLECPVPSLLVLDLDLPGRTGHELLADRRDDERLAALPAVVLTSSTDVADRDRSLELGATLHLLKPVDAQGFISLADRLAALLGAVRSTR